MRSNQALQSMIVGGGIAEDVNHAIKPSVAEHDWINLIQSCFKPKFAV
jgi:hypothetical protein